MTVSGKWLSKKPPASIDQIYMVNGNNAVLSTTEAKLGALGNVTLEDYEAAVKESLEPQNISNYSEDKTMKINGLDARQFSYSVTAKSGAKVTIVQTLIDGKYSIFRVILLTGDPEPSEINQDYQNIVQTFEEVKTSFQLSKEKFGAMKPTERLLDAAHYYRQLGFFEQDKGMANEQFDAKFMEYYKGFAGKAQGPFDSSEFYNGLADMYVLQQDKKRVWMDDTETVAKGNDVYAALLSEWSKISRGAF